MDSSDEDEDEEDDIRWRLRYSRWSIGKDNDDAGAYKAALGRVGRRAKDSVESQDGTAEGLMYARPRTTSTRELSSSEPQSRQENLLPQPLPMPSSSLQPSPPHHLHSPVPTNANIVHRWLHLQNRQDPGRARQIFTTIIGIQGSQWQARCQCPLDSLSTRLLGLRQPHQYRNHDRVPIWVLADRGGIRRVREEGIRSVQGQIRRGRGSIRRYCRF